MTDRDREKQAQTEGEAGGYRQTKTELETHRDRERQTETNTLTHTMINSKKKAATEISKENNNIYKRVGIGILFTKQVTQNVNKLEISIISITFIFL